MWTQWPNGWGRVRGGNFIQAFVSFTQYYNPLTNQWRNEWSNPIFLSYLFNSTSEFAVTFSFSFVWKEMRINLGQVIWDESTLNLQKKHGFHHGWMDEWMDEVSSNAIIPFFHNGENETINQITPTYLSHRERANGGPVCTWSFFSWDKRPPIQCLRG